jgi:hypothetical protein
VDCAQLCAIVRLWGVRTPAVFGTRRATGLVYVAQFANFAYVANATYRGG